MLKNTIPTTGTQSQDLLHGSLWSDLSAIIMEGYKMYTAGSSLQWTHKNLFFQPSSEESWHGFDMWQSTNRTPSNGSMTYAPTTNAPARNANVEAYINPDPNPNPNPYPALNQKSNHTHESNSVFGEVSMPEQLSPEHMSCHPSNIWSACLEGRHSSFSLQVPIPSPWLPQSMEWVSEWYL